MDESNIPACPECEATDDIHFEDCPMSIPRCDVCDMPETCGVDDCTLCPGNWNGEEGIHIDCIGWL